MKLIHVSSPTQKLLRRLSVVTETAASSMFVEMSAHLKIRGQAHSLCCLGDEFNEAG
jgi:hypothetical protein